MRWFSQRDYAHLSHIEGFNLDGIELGMEKRYHPHIAMHSAVHFRMRHSRIPFVKIVASFLNTLLF